MCEDECLGLLTIALWCHQTIHILRGTESFIQLWGPSILTQGSGGAACRTQGLGIMCSVRPSGITVGDIRLAP